MSDKMFTVIAFSLQVLFLVLFGSATDYAVPAVKPVQNAPKPGNQSNTVDDLYPMFQDVHGMMFIGFGFLMAFLYRYGYTSIGVNFLLGALVLQWATLVVGFMHSSYDENLTVNIKGMLTADFAAAAVMITYGAVLGKVSPLQLLVIAFLEVMFFGINEMIGTRELHAVDIGGSMFVHTFGAYFGLALSRVLAPKTREARHHGGSAKETSVYTSDLFSLLGTLILWQYWPSFNAALGSGDQRHRAVINTYYSLAACVVMTFAMSSLLDKKGRFHMVEVQNATLAGGVAVGAAADFLLQPVGALLIGTVAAIISVFGYRYIQPYLQNHVHLHDTCGVHNLHGLPGIMGGLVAAIATAKINTKKYGNSLYQIYPAMAPKSALDSKLVMLTNLNYEYSTGEGRTASEQAGFQVAALLITLCIAVAGGVLTGLIVRLPIFSQPKEFFEDTEMWEVAQERPKSVSEE